MRKLLKAVLAAVLAGAMLFALCMPSQALNSVDCGTYIYKNPSYNKDGKFYMSFDIQAGRPPNTSAGYTSLVNAKLLNPSGQQVLSWGQVEVSPSARKTINYATSYSGRPHGTYTIAVTVTSRGKEYYTGKTISYSFTWRYTINHTGGSSSNNSNSSSSNNTAATPSLSYYSKEIVYSNGSYSNKFVFTHKNANAKYAHMEIYDPQGYKVASGRTSSMMSGSSGTCWFNWTGCKDSNGARCVSGYYTLKYWLDGGSAKSVQLYLQLAGEG